MDKIHITEGEKTTIMAVIGFGAGMWLSKELDSVSGAMVLGNYSRLVYGLVIAGAGIWIKNMYASPFLLGMGIAIGIDGVANIMGGTVNKDVSNIYNLA